MTSDAMTANDTVIKKRSVMIAGHSTSVSMESAFWDQLKQIATHQGVSLNQLITRIDKVRTGNLSSAIRVYILNSLIQRGSELE